MPATNDGGGGEGGRGWRPASSLHPTPAILSLTSLPPAPAAALGLVQLTLSCCSRSCPTHPPATAALGSALLPTLLPPFWVSPCSHCCSGSSPVPHSLILCMWECVAHGCVEGVAHDYVEWGALAGCMVRAVSPG